ncbi:C4-dicarboxylate transporter/malic acid transport protein-like protein [Xylogone sp. PMI_703]|nr:C4-dicarboxylate transporter/malic acid transport protein-like protein [Xylogone sp. PMI_703]
MLLFSLAYYIEEIADITLRTHLLPRPLNYLTMAPLQTGPSQKSDDDSSTQQDKDDAAGPKMEDHTPNNSDTDIGPECGLQPSEADFREQQKREKCLSPKEQRGWRKLIRNFTPSWFAIIMGTGIVSILLHNLPYNGRWLYWISVVIFCLNIFLFVTFLIISILRYTIYPEIWRVMICHPAQSLFLGTFPMGLATIINMIVFVCVPAWGSWAAYLAWGLWWFDIVVSLATCFYLPFVIMYYHQTELSSMTAAWLLPVVATVVASSSGGIVAEVLPNDQYALWTVVISYILWGTGVPLAMTILVIYFQRLTVYKLPPREVIVSVFLPLGPLGQGGFGVMQLGKVAMQVFPKTSTLSVTTTHAGEVLYVMGWMIATIMWGFGLVWLFFALASISRSRFPFNMGWWGFTFPLGVFAVSTTTMGKELPSRFFNVLGTIFSVCVTLLWIMVSIGTIRKAMTGKLLFAPCLKDLEGKEKQAAQHLGEPALTV